VAPEEPVALATPPATQGAAPRTTNRTSTDAISTTAALNRLDEVSESVAAPLLPRQASGHDVHASDAQATPFTSLATQASIAYGAQAPEFTPSRMTLDIQTPLRSPAWPIDLGHVVRLMSRDAVAEADLRITPPELGPIEIRLAIDGDTASIQFAAPTAETRALLETHMPKLREVLESTGLTLSGATVQSGFQRDTRQSSTGDGNGRSGDARDRGADEASDSVRVVGTLRRAEGLVDVFA
jgi:flagellar hook-length control protein FliK